MCSVKEIYVGPYIWMKKKDSTKVVPEKFCPKKHTGQETHQYCSRCGSTIQMREVEVDIRLGFADFAIEYSKKSSVPDVINDFDVILDPNDSGCELVFLKTGTVPSFLADIEVKHSLSADQIEKAVYEMVTKYQDLIDALKEFSDMNVLYGIIVHE